MAAEPTPRFHFMFKQITRSLTTLVCKPALPLASIPVPPAVRIISKVRACAASYLHRAPLRFATLRRRRRMVAPYHGVGIAQGECFEDDGESEAWCAGEYGGWKPAPQAGPSSSSLCHPHPQHYSTVDLTSRRCLKSVHPSSRNPHLGQ
jgi:hypothetical protein